MTSVIDLNAERESRKLRRTVEDYSNYLTLLGPSALAYEANYLAKQVRTYGASNDILEKSKAVISELTKRIGQQSLASGSFKVLQQTLKES